jgi:quercetin dioxygenase-like cupin family protein
MRNGSANHLPSGHRGPIGEVMTATQGAFVSIPRGVTHGFMPVGDGAGAKGVRSNGDR